MSYWLRIICEPTTSSGLASWFGVVTCAEMSSKGPKPKGNNGIRGLIRHPRERAGCQRVFITELQCHLRVFQEELLHEAQTSERGREQRFDLRVNNGVIEMRTLRAYGYNGDQEDTNQEAWGVASRFRSPPPVRMASVTRMACAAAYEKSISSPAAASSAQES